MKGNKFFFFWCGGVVGVCSLRHCLQRRHDIQHLVIMHILRTFLYSIHVHILAIWDIRCFQSMKENDNEDRLLQYCGIPLVVCQGKLLDLELAARSPGPARKNKRNFFMPKIFLIPMTRANSTVESDHCCSHKVAGSRKVPYQFHIKA